MKTRKQLIVIVSADEAMHEHIQAGIPKGYDILRAFRNADACRAFIAESDWDQDDVYVIVDSYLGEQLPVEGGPSHLSPDSPSIQLMERIHATCPKWCILCITRPGCYNDAELALGQPPHWYTLSSDVPGWEGLLGNALNDAKTLKDLVPAD